VWNSGSTVASCAASGSGPAIETGAWPRRPQAARAQPRNRIVTAPLTWRTHQASPARVMKTRPDATSPSSDCPEMLEESEKFQLSALWMARRATRHQSDCAESMHAVPRNPGLKPWTIGPGQNPNTSWRITRSRFRQLRTEIALHRYPRPCIGHPPMAADRFCFRARLSRGDVKLSPAVGNSAHYGR